MISWHGVHPATLGSLLIEAMCIDADGLLVGSHTGTGFVYRLRGKTFLVTNWHIVTGRNPDNPLSLIATGARASPVRIEFCVPLKSNHNHFVPGGVDLYAEGQPIWLEMRDVGGKIDLVAIPVQFPDDAFVVTVQDFAADGGYLSIGDDVIVIGFPFGRYRENPHATWKRAMVASEPGILLSGQPRYFVDVAGRPGMSGSPVYATSPALRTAAETANMGENPALSAVESIAQIDRDSPMLDNAKNLRFVGVYSNPLADKALADLNYGFCWHSGLIGPLIQEARRGYNPESPQFHAQS